MSRIRNPLHLEIIPSPGTLSIWGDIEKRIQSILPFTESVHIDVTDGKFVPTTTWLDAAPFAKYTKQANFEVHLMVDDPVQYVRSFADAGFQRIIGQIEKMPDVTEFIAQTQLFAEVGLALDGPTGLSSLQGIHMDDIDLVLLYTGDHAGLSGGVLIPEKLEKVKQLRREYASLPIEIDGGVNDATILSAKNAGATRFVSTGFIFSGNPEENYNKLKDYLG